MWGIETPLYDHIRPFWVGYYKRQAIRQCCYDIGMSWKQLYRQGFRAVRVTIEKRGKGK